MSKCDQNCLLSYLWGEGSSLAILDISNSKKRANSNRFIKKMCHGDDSWDYGTSKEMQRENVFNLSFSHLSVTPREIMEARQFEKKDAVCLLFEKTNADGVNKSIKEKIIPLGYLPFDKLIYNSIYAITNAPEDIMQLLKNKEIEEYKKKHSYSSKRYRLFGFQFKWCTTDESKRLKNVGKDEAMKRILLADKTKTKTIAAGNIPIISKANRIEEKLECTFGLFTKTTYTRLLSKSVEQALNRQKDYRKCLDVTSLQNLTVLPYSKNIFVKQWAKRLQKHLVEINRSQFMNQNGSLIKKFNMYSVNNSQEDMFTYFQRLLFKNSSALFAPIDLDVKDWYKKWLDEYKKDLQKAKSMKHGDIMSDFVHKHYKELKQKSYRSVPIKWLQDNNLLIL